MAFSLTTTFVASALSTAASGPAVRRRLLATESIDRPNARSSHVLPTPRGGGLACAVGGVVGCLTARAMNRGVSAQWAASGALLGAVGRLDDVFGLSAAPRLGAQFLVGAVAGGSSGGVLGSIVGAVATPSIVNAFNFMDGINGISGGTALAWGLVLGTDESLSQSVRVQAAITAGMGLGFLPHNIPNASMFLGDVGSYLFGGGIAATVVHSALDNGRPTLGTVLRTLAPLAPYLADTGLTIARRAARGEKLTVAHREHAYQQLVSATQWPHWAVAGIASGAAAVCGVSARYQFGGLVVATAVGLYLIGPRIAAAAGVGAGASGFNVSGGGGK